MSFEAILRYQEIDEEIRKEEESFENRKFIQDYKQLENKAKISNKTFNNDVKESWRLEDSCNDILEKLNKLEVDVNETYEEAEKELASYTSIDDMDDYIPKQLNKLENLLKELESKSNSTKTTLTKLEEEIKNSISEFRKAKVIVDKYKGEFDRLNTEKDEKIKALEAEKAGLENQIDPTLLAKYKRQSNNGKVQAIYEMPAAFISRGNCAKCFKIIDHVMDKLKNPGDYVECPECNSILIVK